MQDDVAWQREERNMIMQRQQKSFFQRREIIIMKMTNLKMT